MGLKIYGLKNKIYDDIILMFLFVAVLGYMPTSRAQDGYIWGSAVLIFIANTVLKKKKIKLTNSLLWYGIMVMYGLLSCIWSLNTIRFERFFIQTFLVILCIIICLSGYMDSEQDVKRILYILMIAGCIAGFRYCYYTDWSKIFSTGYYMRGTFGGLLDDVTNYNNYTSPLCIVCIIASYFSFYKNKKWCYIPFVILMAILIFGGSRKTIIVIPLVSIFFAMFQGNVKKKVKSISFAVALIFIIWIFMEKIEFLSQIKIRLYSIILNTLGNSEIQLDNSSYLRMEMRQAGLDVWKNNLFFGVGWDNFRNYNSIDKVTAHNNYIEILASLGLIGFIIYYFYYINFIIARGKFIFGRYKDDWSILVTGILISIVSLEYGSVTLYARGTMLLLLIILLSYSIVKGKYKTFSLFH